MNCANQLNSCVVTRGMCTYVGRESECPMHAMCPAAGGNSPSIEVLCELYKEAARDRMQRTGQLTDNEVRRSISTISRFMDACGIAPSEPMSAITRRRLADFAGKLKESGLSSASVSSCITSIQRVCCRWARAFYEDRGYDVRAIDVPDIPKVRGEYHSIADDKLTELKIWYNRLASSDDHILHAYAMFIYHFAMRNGDVDRLTWGAFSEQRGKRVLTYTPHKTRLKSRRVVRIEVGDEDWYHLTRIRGNAADADFVIPGRGGSHECLRDKLNRQMRALGFTGSKGAYELRKVCGDTYKRRFGVDMAKAILGHTMVTGSTAHYVDGNSEIVPTIW